MARQLALENTMPFQGLPELVAYHEGLFAAEGLEITWVDRTRSAPRQTDRGITDPNAISSLLSHGSASELGQASLYNACEWGNYRRSQDNRAGARQVGRRAIVAFGAIIVRPDSDIYTPQQLARKTIGLPYHAGTHYLALQLLEGFLAREDITTCLAPNSSRLRYDSLLNGELDATTVTEPYITLAEKEGCRVIAMAPYHGTEVATADVDAEVYGAFNRAIREAVRRINADKRKYLRYFIDYHRSDPRVAALTVDDFDPARLQVIEPEPIPRDELRRTYQWMLKWDLLDPATGAEKLVDAELQAAAHAGR
jgi:NitT/TauT family transport system substrate-binding protein